MRTITPPHAPAPGEPGCGPSLRAGLVVHCATYSLSERPVTDNHQEHPLGQSDLHPDIRIGHGQGSIEFGTYLEDRPTPWSVGFQLPQADDAVYHRIGGRP